jgi:hypothetical protein
MIAELERLAEITENLKSHIDDQADAIAGPRIVRVKRRAERRVSELERAHAAELRRLNDLVDELRLQLRPLDRMFERTKQATFTQRSEALGLGLECHRCEALIVEVEPGSTLTEVMTAYAHHACGVADG